MYKRIWILRKFKRMTTVEKEEILLNLKKLKTVLTSSNSWQDIVVKALPINDTITEIVQNKMSKSNVQVCEFKFSIGDIVYLKTDVDQDPRMVTAMTLRQTGIIYELSIDSRTSWHIDLEISTEKNLIPQ